MREEKVGVIDGKMICKIICVFEEEIVLREI